MVGKQVLRGEERRRTARKARQLYDQGMSTWGVAGQLGLTYGTTRALLVEAGTDFRNTMKPVLVKPERVALRQTARTLYESGLSAREVAKRIKCSYGMTRSLIVEAGGKFRKWGG
jgi:orotate phosphoribosyltransferase-like protein